MSSRPDDSAVPEWRQDLLQDGEAFWGDQAPTLRQVAGRIIKEASFAAVFLYRLSVRLERQGRPTLSLLVMRLNQILNGCEIAVRARIGPGLHLPHPYGVVVGWGVTIGSRATLFQNVTLGDRSANGSDFPTLGNGVVIFANAVVVGAIHLGDGCRVGAGSVVLQSVAAGATVVGLPASPIDRSARPRRAGGEE
jgi:serine O-acetyltransferase